MYFWRRHPAPAVVLSIDGVAVAPPSDLVLLLDDEPVAATTGPAGAVRPALPRPMPVGEMVISASSESLGLEAELRIEIGAESPGPDPLPVPVGAGSVAGAAAAVRRAEALIGQPLGAELRRLRLPRLGASRGYLAPVSLIAVQPPDGMRLAVDLGLAPAIRVVAGPAPPVLDVLAWVGAADRWGLPRPEAREAVSMIVAAAADGGAGALVGLTVDRHSERRAVSGWAAGVSSAGVPPAAAALLAGLRRPALVM